LRQIKEGLFLVLYQPVNGYCYNSDTHFLFNFIVENFKKYKNIKGELLDIGSGSGILGLLVAKEFSKLNLNQCEIQKMFQFFSQKNASTNKINSHLYEGSFEDIEFNKKFDICVSNPPFYHCDVIKSENESLKIARYNDSLPLEILIKRAASILNSEGKFFFCYDVKQINEILLLLNKYKFNLEALQFVHPKNSKDATLILVYAKRNSKSLTKILSPLIVFDENNEFTLQVKDIYIKSSTHSIKVDIE
jgi:tRNA1(Val) A37 N6-methylase TrmN6